MQQLLSIALFFGVALAFVMLNMIVGKIVRPRLPNPDKLATYECGETTIGNSLVQFDLRFYIVALFYLVFDVEVALIYPWAVIYRQVPVTALLLGLPFLGIVVLGYAYEWRSGSLDWVRSSINTSIKGGGTADLSELARHDPEFLAEQATQAQ